jgi:predicted metal-binding membrane protein
MAAEAAHGAPAHAHATAHPDAGAVALPPVAKGLVALVAVVVALAWAVTWTTADDHMALLGQQVAGASPTSTGLFLLLSGIMMVAMMLPSGLPMVHAYHGLAALEAGPGEARLRTALFTTGYFVVWAAFTASALVALATFGALGATGAGALAPGVVLVAAGAYQLTGWKQFCLRHCRTPTAFIMTHWRKGRGGAVRMGLAHAAYCLGCCWLLMLVLFTAGAMSVLWMGVFTLLILGEKTWARGEAFGRAMGVLGILVGLAALGGAWMGWPVPPSGSAPGGMGGMGDMPGMRP